MKCKVLAFLLGIGLMSIPPFSLLMSPAKADITEEEDTVSAIAEDVYDFALNLKVPQVLENNLSTGYRKFKAQKIQGKMYIVWMDNGTFRIEFSGLVNKNFKVCGVNVTYKGTQDESIYPRFNFIGNNKTEKFTTPCICFSVLLEPSYALGGATEDNSFVLVLSARGTSSYMKKYGCTIATKFSGYATGHQGCGCIDYGHKSPTRNATLCGPGEEVNDVVTTYGTWSAKWKGRCFCRSATQP